MSSAGPAKYWITAQTAILGGSAGAGGARHKQKEADKEELKEEVK